jgi:DNA polymerase-3 subunit delta'
MAWHGIEGHDEVVEQFRRAIRRGRLGSSFLFVGPAGIGKRAFAVTLAQALLCRDRDEVELDPCGKCPACSQIIARTHPDLEIVEKPADKSALPLELLIGDKEHRMRQGLCHNIGMKPFMGGRKVAIIDDADYLNAEGANCLLKTLEEPPPRSILILLSTSAAKQLPTVRSRCQMIRFRPLTRELVASILLSRGLAPTTQEAQRLAEYSGGSVQAALGLASPDLWEFRARLFDGLRECPLDIIQVGALISAFIEGGGKEASARRLRTRQAIGFATEYFLAILHAQSGEEPAVDDASPDWLRDALAQWPTDPAAAIGCLEGCLDAGEQIDRNVNPTTLVECWVNNLSKKSGEPRIRPLGRAAVGKTR